ncbi:hypothetical protein DFH07DRAFT_307830 [Mycena maculata]|uniref:F-box domain-containing protein n=1 Tax=Mycena maculata TaxID=230809 RepID=A0AAD7HHL8_9AGAR|nr:hypothetical protein DFH07DRAFT_307830 [Mycena maculata]
MTYLPDPSSMEVGPPTLPQELIDFILDQVADARTYRTCSRVARSFRQTSQKHIFSHIELRPAYRYWGNSDSSVRDLSRILLCSPHLALNVRSIILAHGNGDAPWMSGDTFSKILHALVNLTKISIESDNDSDSWLHWAHLPLPLMNAVQSTVSLPSLTSIRLHHVFFDRNTELVSLLQCCTNLDSLALFRLGVQTMDSDDTETRHIQFGPSSLEMQFCRLPLLHSVTSAVDLRRLRHFRITLLSPAMEAEIRDILDATEALVHCHISLSHSSTDADIISLRNLSLLRTLEITAFFDLAISPDGYDPVLWMRNVLATARGPSPIQQVILNLHVQESDLPYLSRLADLEALFIAPEMAVLRNVTVCLDSHDLDFSVQGGEWEVREAFPVLLDRELLEIKLLGVP